MNESGQARRRRLPLVLASVVLALVVLPAAGSGAAGSGNASAHDVAEGLKKIQSIAVDTAAWSGKDKVKAAQFAGSIEGVWKTIEDTVRGNEKNSYVIFEGAFDTLGAAAKAGDATKAGKAANQISTAVRGYLSVHPDVPAATPRAAAVAPSGTASGSAGSGSAASASAASAPSGSPASGSAASAPSGSAASASAASAPSGSPASAPSGSPASGSAASAPSGSAAPTPSTASAAPGPDSASATPSATPAAAGGLARTGPHTSALAAVAGVAFALGGLAFIAGARRRRALSPTA